MEWRLRAIRGATTVTQNTVEAIGEAVTEMLDELEAKNQLEPTQIISATFTVTRDLDAIFPAAIARTRPYWDSVPMLDVQQMHVKGSLERCIRCLIYVAILICVKPKICDLTGIHLSGLCSHQSRCNLL